MKHLRKFENVQTMNTTLANSTIGILGLAYEGGNAIIKNKPTPPDPTIPFYIDVRGPVSLYAATSGLQMSTDKTNWTDTIATTLPSGKTYFRVASDQTKPLQPKWDEDENSDYDIGGNINSLVKVNFENDTNCYSFYEFFAWFQKLKSAGKLILPATTLATYCYAEMFHGCTSLTSAPALPATTLAQECYYMMFQGCTSLTTAPALPATTLANYCYYYMFYGCTSLTSAPALPATTLAECCYQQMFYGCTSLTSALAILPAATLAEACYCGMFWGCTSLTTAPALPATTLANDCYDSMFANCTNLNYIKCLATDILATNCTNNWTNGVSATGTFVKNPNMSNWTTGTSGIPEGWTVQDAQD